MIFAVGHTDLFQPSVFKGQNPH